MLRVQTMPGATLYEDAAEEVFLDEMTDLVSELPQRNPTEAELFRSLVELGCPPSVALLAPSWERMQPFYTAYLRFDPRRDALPIDEYQSLASIQGRRDKFWLILAVGWFPAGC